MMTVSRITGEEIVAGMQVYDTQTGAIRTFEAPHSPTFGRHSGEVIVNGVISNAMRYSLRVLESAVEDSMRRSLADFNGLSPQSGVAVP